MKTVLARQFAGLDPVRLLRDIRVTQKALGDDDRRSDADTAPPGDVKTTSLGMECSFALLATGSYPALKSSRKIQQRSSTSRGGRISGIEAFVHDSSIILPGIDRPIVRVRRGLSRVHLAYEKGRLTAAEFGSRGSDPRRASHR
jgi:hypothetical protein